MKRGKPVRRRRKIAIRRASPLKTKRTEDWSEMAKLYKPIKKPVTLRLDADVLAWFRKRGPGYQTRINRALRGLMTAERKKSGA